MTDNVTLGHFNEKKICEVCGDQALSYNFNALTCESCKAFFRRNANKDKLKCAFKNNCPINRVTRKFCQCCRLRKCYSVGMKRELIMSEMQKDMKRRKIEANRAKALKQQTGNKTNGVNSTLYDDYTTSSNKTTSLIEQSIQTNIFMGNQSEQDISSLYLNNFALNTSKVDCSTQTQPEQVDSSAQTDTWECKCLPPLSGTSATDVINIHENKVCKLDARYTKLLDDLVVANGALDAPLENEANNMASDAFQVCSAENGGSLLDVINLTAIAIRRLIKMCKRISGFKALCTQDQVSLLKHGCTQMMLLRSVLNFDPDKNSWKIPHTVNQLSRIKVEVLKEAQGNLYEAHEHFLTTFDPRASRDKYLIYILTAIELFDPTRSNLVHSDTIRQQQECYYSLLKQYLENEFGQEEAVSIFDHLLSKMEELHRLCEDHIRVYLNVNPSQVEPLLIEIFDLKPH